MQEKVYYQTKTTNKSFLEMHKYLKTIGVKNNKFMFTIYDKDLIDIDPYDNTLSSNMKAKILVECTKNFWYFIREVVRISTQDGSFEKYRLHVANMALNFLTLQNINTIIETSRLQCQTISELCLFAWRFRFSTIESKFSLSDIDIPNARINVLKLKTIISNLPSYMQEEKYIKDNLHELKNMNKNIINIIPSYNSAEKVTDIGKNLNSQFQFFDNFSFVKFNKQAIQRSIISKNCEKNNDAHYTSISLIPAPLKNESGQFALELINHSHEWNNVMYDLTREDLLNLLSSTSANGFVSIIYGYEDTDQNPEEYNRKMKAVLPEDVYRREVLLKWF